MRYIIYFDRKFRKGGNLLPSIHAYDHSVVFIIYLYSFIGFISIFRPIKLEDPSANN